MELITFEELKSFLSLEGASLSAYPALALIKSSVEDGIESYLGLEFNPDMHEKTVTFFPSGPTRFFDVKALPILAVTAVTVGGTELSYDSLAYKRRPSGITLPAATDKEVSITYMGGYTTKTLPEAIKRAALYQTVFEWQQKDIVGAETVVTDQGTVNKPGFKMLPEVCNILAPFRHPGLIA